MKTSVQSDIQIVPNADALRRTAAAEVLSSAEAAVREKGSFTVVLSGGSTPKGLYALLVDEASWRARAPWEKTHFFWGDERHVPPDHPDSNYRMAYEVMLSKVPIPTANIHRIKSEYPSAEQAAAEYEHTLREFFRVPSSHFPRFDLVLLGMGPDGHTASLFPGTAALHEQRRWVVANWVEQLKTYRLTLTLPVLNNAARAIFLVSDAEKADMLRVVLEDDVPSAPFPAQLIRPTHGRVLWLIDAAAARLLHGSAK